MLYGAGGIRSPVAYVVYAPSDPPSVAVAHIVCAFPRTLGATYVSNPQQGSRTERRGFEPLVPFGTQPFQDCTLNRSDISPRFEKKGFHAEAFHFFLKKLGYTLNHAISVRIPGWEVVRREGDSNPRILADQRFSRPPESTALASLQAFYSRLLTVRD